MAGGVRRDEHVGHGPQGVIGRQRLLLEDVERGARDLARRERRHQVVELRRHAAADVDEVAGALHAREPPAVHEALRLRRVGHGEDDEVGQRQQRVQRVGAVEFEHAGRGIAATGVDAHHVHAERGAEPGRLGADPAHAHDERARLGQVDDAVRLLALRPPLAAELARNVVVQAPREGQHEGHDVRGDVVVVDLAEVGDDDRVIDQLPRVVAGRRRGLRGLQPAELAGGSQQRRRDRAEGGLGRRRHARGVVRGFSYDHVQGRHGRGDARGPLPGLVALGGQHQKRWHVS